MALELIFDRVPANELEQINTVIAAAAWRSPGIDFVGDSEYLVLGFMLTDESLFNASVAYVDAFGEPPVGTMIPCRAWTVHNVTGLSSAALDVRAIVAV